MYFYYNIIDLNLFHIRCSYIVNFYGLGSLNLSDDFSFMCNTKENAYFYGHPNCYWKTSEFISPTYHF